MNLLSGFEKSIVTPVAGTTRDVVEETVNLGSVTLKLCDTAGIRNTDDTVEKIGVERSKSRMDTADLILAVFDGSSGFDTEDEALLDSLNRDISIVVFNKSDKGQPDVAVAEKRDLKWVIMSAENGSGLGDLQEAVMAVTKTANLNGKSAIYLNERQRNCAKRALSSIDEAIDCAAQGFTVDAVGVLIDDALSALMEITGERVTVEVANEVFKRFCVGK
jgi:tRNA modification GTPase